MPAMGVHSLSKLQDGILLSYSAFTGEAFAEEVANVSEETVEREDLGVCERRSPPEEESDESG